MDAYEINIFLNVYFRNVILVIPDEIYCFHLKPWLFKSNTVSILITQLNVFLYTTNAWRLHLWTDCSINTASLHIDLSSKEPNSALLLVYVHERQHLVVVIVLSDTCHAYFYTPFCTKKLILIKTHLVFALSCNALKHTENLMMGCLVEM